MIGTYKGIGEKDYIVDFQYNLVLLLPDLIYMKVSITIYS